MVPLASAKCHVSCWCLAKYLTDLPRPPSHCKPSASKFSASLASSVNFLRCLAIELATLAIGLTILAIELATAPENILPYFSYFLLLCFFMFFLCFFYLLCYAFCRCSAFQVVKE